MTTTDQDRNHALFLRQLAETQDGMNQLNRDRCRRIADRLYPPPFDLTDGMPFPTERDAAERMLEQLQRSHPRAIVASDRMAGERPVVYFAGDVDIGWLAIGSHHRIVVLKP